MISVSDKKKKNDSMKGIFSTKKSCRFCVEHVAYIDYKEIKILRGLLTDRGKIVPRRISGNCARHQRQLTTAVKRARHVALLSFTVK